MAMEMRMHDANPFSTLQRMQTAPVPAAEERRPSSGNIKKPKTQSANMSGHVSNNSLIKSQAHTSSNYSIQSQSLSGQSSRSSDGTTGTSTSTLFPPPVPPINGQPQSGEVTATDNVMNTVADASSSLFQICITLRQRLSALPGFNQALMQTEEDGAEDDIDVVTVLWRTFRHGYPLMLLYNTLRPDQPISMPANVKEDKRAKAATAKFLQACITDLKFPPEECFMVTELFNNDTTGFVKVAKVVNRVLDILVERGMIEDLRPSADDYEQTEKGKKRTQREHIISELVTTERTYVQHLELLQTFKNLVQERGSLLGDAVHDIFFNINELLNFQRRFLISIEQTNALPEDDQNWGKLFALYCEPFMVYEQYIANQRKCDKTVLANFDKLASAASNASIEMRQLVESAATLQGFLMKPFQRLSKYPLLLDDLYKKGDLDEARKADLLIGREAATSVLTRTNFAVDREEKAEAVQELKYRVEDWKGHRVESFGTLLLYGTFTVLKGENMGAGGKEGERQYHVYLFETILLCCKDIDISKPKNKLSTKQLVDKRGKPKLQLKGRIFMQNVTDLISLSKPGSYTCQIFWHGDPSIENFVIRFTTEEMMKKWSQQIELQRRKYRDKSARGSEGSRSLGTSTTEFEFMRNQPQMVNPYADPEDEDEDEDDVDTLVGSGTGMSYFGGVSDFEQSSRNGSFSSLRSRGESVSSNAARGQPSGRYPHGMGHPNLSLRTRELSQHGGTHPDLPLESWFSPTDGSPSTLASSRTSASSGMYSAFPMSVGQQLRGQNGTPVDFYQESQYQPNSARSTMPAIARQRESSGVGQSQPAQRVAPPRPGMHSAAQMQPRNRSASSPDIHNQPRPGMPPGAPPQGQPPVPNVPAPYLHNTPALIPRSQTNSPSLANGYAPPPRGQNVSPQADRRRIPSGHQQYKAASGTITPTPPGPAFSPPPIPALAGRPTSVDTLQGAPTQLKVKVVCSDVAQILTLVVPINISYQSLKDRIDAKLQRSTNLSLSDRISGANQVKLKYSDGEDKISIQNDEDVQEAFESWKDAGSGVAEVELFCMR